MRRLTAASAAMVLAMTATALAGAAPASITITQLAKAPDTYVGKQVVVTDCMINSHNDLIGTQCMPTPIDPSLIAYIDSATMSADAKKLGKECGDIIDITKKCLVKVTGTVAKDGRGQALIKNGTIELVKYVAAF